MAKSEEKCVPLRCGRERLQHEEEVAIMTSLFQRPEILDEKRVKRPSLVSKKRNPFSFLRAEHLKGKREIGSDSLG